MNEKSLQVVKAINQILARYEMPITIRTIYYQLVSGLIIPNTIKSYKNYNRIAVKGRREGLIDTSRIVDSSKPLIKTSSWINPLDFIQTVKCAYKKSIWDNQPEYVEVWIEKDALSCIIEPTTSAFDCYLAVGRGYQSLSNKNEAKERFEEMPEKQKTILYFGDFDPTGLDISRDITAEFIDDGVKVERIALNEKQVRDYNLPPILTKPTDSRTAKHIEQYGNVAVELDALPPNMLTKLCKDAIMSHLDISAFNETKEQEKEDLSKIEKWAEACE